MQRNIQEKLLLCSLQRSVSVEDPTQMHTKSSQAEPRILLASLSARSARTLLRTDLAPLGDNASGVAFEFKRLRRLSIFAAASDIVRSQILTFLLSGI